MEAIAARVEEPAPEFEFSGGRLCLDFTNTLGGRGRPQPREDLNRYADLLAWGQQAGLLTDVRATRLAREADGRPGAAAAVRDRALILREAIYRIFSAVVGGGEAREADLAALNAELAIALPNARLVPSGAGFAWTWDERADALDRILWPVARSAADLLTSDELDRVRECAETRCGWLFMDTSRNRSRQWCDMKVCGNRAKARRHYERRRGGRRQEAGDRRQ
jgi:predicted RNA-binding Zn ribbon-like protein